MTRRVTARVRTAYHEAGHLVAWSSAPFAPPVFVSLGIEPDRRVHTAGALCIASAKSRAASTDAWVHRLHVGRALGAGSHDGLALALSEALAHVRIDAAGVASEALLEPGRVRARSEDACDYWNAYELCALLGLDPEPTWRRELARARAWLAQHWDAVCWVAERLLALPRGRGRLSGAALGALARKASPRASRRFGAHAYRALARHMLRAHARATRDRALYRVVQLIPPSYARYRGVGPELAVVWDADERAAASALASLRALAVVAPRLSPWSFALRAPLAQRELGARR